MAACLEEAWLGPWGCAGAALVAGVATELAEDDIEQALASSDDDGEDEAEPSRPRAPSDWPSNRNICTLQPEKCSISPWNIC